MNRLYELGFRTNIETFTVRGKRVIIYQDHRTILNVLYFALKEKIISKTPNVFYFDYHDDALDPTPKAIEKATTFNLEESTFRDFHSFVEFDMKSDDSDWVKTGMEFNLINDSVLIGARDNHNLSTSNEEYTDSKGNLHQLFSISHLKFELGSQGSLGDSQIDKMPYYRKLRDLFNYNTTGYDKFNNVEQPFVLDFDLDYFSSSIMERQMAWPEKLFHEELIVKSDNGVSALDFINHLIDNCELITIATEPKYCGGMGECSNILKLVDKYIFERQLKTITYA